ncbi:MAG: peptidoglycan editing factor PgeF [Ruminococcaceae bacterium]|nr:peptidoglycan editing factor PgeF [Oscillospiraceae bacterium]
MFYLKNNVYRSTFLDSSEIGHGFSTRAGGKSELPHTKTMNLSFTLGDSDDTVRENMKLLCAYTETSYEGLVGSPQFHSAEVRYVTKKDAHEGVDRENTSPSDGFVTDMPGMTLIIRMADCTPILLYGKKKDGSPVVSAVHAGWKGTVSGIGKEAVSKMTSLGADPETIKVAIGQCIHSCHFEVKDDFKESVTAAKGADFAQRHIKEKDGKLFADLVSMNMEILEEAGIKRENVDVSPFCSVCAPDVFHSHRATGGKRGTMGAVIGIKPENIR